MTALKPLAVLAALCTLTVSGCVNALSGSGHVVALRSSATGFSCVEVESGCEAVVTHADSFSVVVHIDDNLSDHVNVTLQGRTLKIFMDPGHAYPRMDFRAEITMPKLSAIEASGGSEVFVTGFTSDQPLAVGLSGGSSLSGAAGAGPVSLELSGGSELELDGRGGALTLTAGGGSEARLHEFTVTDARVNLSGGSEATVTVSGALSGELSGGSSLYYAGSPATVTVSKSGGSEVCRRP